MPTTISGAACFTRIQNAIIVTIQIDLPTGQFCFANIVNAVLIGVRPDRTVNLPQEGANGSTIPDDLVAQCGRS